MIGPLPGDIFRQGQILNNTYEIEGVLGRGGTGEVYRAKNLVSGRVLAIKALNAQFSGNDDYIELMKREEQMRDVMDDAVVRYSECSRSDQGHVFLVMDFIDGPSMADVMARRRMEPRELMIVAHRVAEGLVAAHRRGIVHRDLSPDNVILRGGVPERATIIDFGIAKDTAAGARTIVGNDFAGKYEYAAPEQLEGRAEPRSDLYALGALLLASFRGQVPFAGATPGEMIRLKQQPLDLVGVPEPLCGLIGWLTAPKLDERAPSAAAVVAQIDRSLKPVAGTAPRPRSRASLWLALPVLLVLAGAGAWQVGLFDRFLVQPLPVASPYALAASAAPPRLSGNAPDAESATAIATAFAQASGTPQDAAALTLAQGMPSPDWPAATVRLFEALAGLDGWSLALQDGAATVSGLAPDRSQRTDIEQRLEEWAAQHGFRLMLDLATGPRLLPYETVAATLTDVADCGSLVQSGTPGQPYGLGDRIEITGPISDARLGPAIEDLLRDRIGDRSLRVSLTALNEDLCSVRKVLPILPETSLSLWLGQGASGAANLSGIFHRGDNPVIEVLAPADLEGRLWVAIVDNTGKVFNVLPNISFAETSLAALGRVEGGVRRIRVVHSLAEWQADTSRVAFTVNDGDYGKSEIIAILSKEELFDTRRPRDESIASFAEALAAIQAERPGNIVGMTSRIIDARP